ncbi:hypothetical protein [Methylobacterium aquaticum]|uniref:Uncharacterized protein n=1 Tax=Methylobacterium aquaticum TaxID=270351 RepID=A0A0J6V5W2_9HYPH|nr:hypothetical protein [Methylobacterium aquaticum]KMO34301.1 hypothetical protein VP06_14620 [Methylobacterium aquaticum]
MTDYSDAITCARLVLTRTPMDPSLGAYRYDGALLRMSRNGSVSLVERGYSGARMIPLEERYHVALAAPLGDAEARACVIDLVRLRADLEEGGCLSVLLDRMAEGHTAGRERGTLTEDAEEAYAEFVEICATRYLDDRFTVLDVTDWLVDGGGLGALNLSATSSEAEIAAAAEVVLEGAHRDGIVLIGTPLEALRALVEEARSECIEDADAE